MLVTGKEANFFDEGSVRPGRFGGIAPGTIGVTFEKLKADSTFRSLSDDDLWDIVAFIWQKNTSPDNLLEGKKTYQVNCAACHGETGAG
ncbi:MAG: cytochrome c, partial [Planctomycetota bacterium]